MQRSRIYVLVSIMAAALPGCAQQLSAVPSPMLPTGPCNESAAQFALNKIADAKLAEEARVRATAQRVRVVRPGDMVTMEFDAGRLTLDVDANGKVVRARCG